MATFNVFVVGPVDDSPMGLPELADAMSQRYGLAATDLISRLKRGRFRVKSNLDAPTAERYRKDLESIGARVVVEDTAVSPTATPVAGVPVTRPSGLSLPPINEAAGASPEEPRTFTILGPQHPREPARPSSSPAMGAPPNQSSTAPMGDGAPPNRSLSPAMGGPPNRPATPPSGLSAARSHTSTPPSGLSAAGSRASTPPPVRPSTPIPADMVSGLSAGFGETAAQADLGALGDGMLSLSSLDGEEAPAASNQFDAPPPEPEKPVVKIAAKPKTDTPRTKPAPSKAMDLFAPPDAGDQDLKVDLAIEEVAERAQKKASVPPENVTHTQATAPSQSPAMRRTPVSMTAVGESRSLEGATTSNRPFSREHFLISVVIGLVVGFIPAHFVASMRERSAFATIDAQVVAAGESADSIETYQALDSARTKLLDDKQSKRSMIGLTSMLLWAVVSTGVGFAFFKLKKR